MIANLPLVLTEHRVGPERSVEMVRAGVAEGVTIGSMIEYRNATTTDVEFLWEMLFYASQSHRETGVTFADTKRNPDLIRHIGGWGRPGDIGTIAWSDGRRVGACWLRLILEDERGDGSYYDDVSPELVIAVEPDQVGTGIGSALLVELLHVADHAKVPSIVLTARATNPAVALYERNDFVLVERLVNRVGTESVKMVRVRPTEIGA